MDELNNESFPRGGEPRFTSVATSDNASDQELRKLGRRTTWGGVIMIALLVLGAAAIAAFFWVRNRASGARWAAYESAQEQSQSAEEFLSRIRPLLPAADFADVKIRIMQKLAQYRDTEAVSLVIAELHSEVSIVRAQAARTLAAIGSPGADAAKPHLLRVLPRTDVADRAPVVWALAVLGEAAASEAIIEEFRGGRLQGQEGFDPRVVSAVLGPQRLSSDALLNHDEVSVRTLTAEALAETATPEIVEPLGRLVRFELARGEPDENVLRAAASGLGRAGDERAGQALVNLLAGRPRMRAVVLDALRRTVGAPGLATLLDSTSDVSIERELVRTLARGHDPRALETLADLLDHADAEIQQHAAFGLAELGDARSVPVLLALARADDLATARQALLHLRELGAPGAASGLMEMLHDARFRNRRASVLRALGRTGALGAGPVVLRYLDGEDASSAALALAELDFDPAYNRMQRLLPRPPELDLSQPRVANEDLLMLRTAAVRATGRYGRLEAAPALMRIIEDAQDDRRVRLEAGYALGAVADNDVRRQVLAKISDHSLDEYARRYFVPALWQRPDPALVEALLDVVARAETPSELRTAAALAVGYAGADSADERVSRMLAQPERQASAALMVVLGGTAPQARALMALLADNAELATGLREALSNEENHRFDLLTNTMFDSGQVFRRLRVALVLAEGEGDRRYTFVLNHITHRLGVGWDGHDGMTARAIRSRLWEALRGDDEARSEWVAQVLGRMDERGLLLAARDQGGKGSAQARAQLRRMNSAAR